MTRTAMAKICLTVTLTGGAFAGSTGIAAAGSPSGNCALNMVNTHTWTADNTGGMAIAMGVNNPNGDGVPGGTTGMFGAVTHSCQ